MPPPQHQQPEEAQNRTQESSVPKGPTPLSERTEGKQVNRKGSGKITFDLPLPSLVPVRVLHTPCYRPASWGAQRGSAPAPQPLPPAWGWCNLPLP